MESKKVIGLVLVFIGLVLLSYWMYVEWFSNESIDVTQETTTQTDGEEDQNNTLEDNNNDNSAMTENEAGNEVTIKNVVEGTGEAVGVGDTVAVLYTGKLEDGTVFDASVKHGNEPLEFTIGAQQMIPGFDQGVRGMKVGGTRTIVIPAELGYGSAGRPPVIPGGATLIFDVELVSVK